MSKRVLSVAVFLLALLSIGEVKSSIASANGGGTRLLRTPTVSAISTDISTTSPEIVIRSPVHRQASGDRKS